MSLKITNEVLKQQSVSQAFRLLLLVLVLRPFGNLSLAWGMHHVGNMLSMSPVSYLRPMFNPFVVSGILLLLWATLTRMALLSVADLSLVLPLSGAGYVLSTLLGKIFLHEQISRERWTGVLLILLGTVVVGSTSGKRRPAPNAENNRRSSATDRYVSEPKCVSEGSRALLFPVDRMLS